MVLRELFVSEELGRVAYAICMLAALIAFVLIKRWQPHSSGTQMLSPINRFLLGWAAFVGGALGGKLPFLVTDTVGFWSLQAWLADGKTITTALLGAYLSVELCKWLLGVRAKTGDAYALPLAVALAIGRLGCFLNGCCYGMPSSLPWAVDYGAGAVHPTQLYEILFHAIAALLLWALPSELPWLRNHRLKAYLLAYCLFRFTTEWIRPEPADWWGLTFYQVVVLLFAAGLSLQWLWDARQQPLSVATT